MKSISNSCSGNLPIYAVLPFLKKAKDLSVNVVLKSGKQVQNVRKTSGHEGKKKLSILVNLLHIKKKKKEREGLPSSPNQPMAKAQSTTSRSTMEPWPALWMTLGNWCNLCASHLPHIKWEWQNQLSSLSLKIQTQTYRRYQAQHRGIQKRF